jgi:hypothetical protein
MALDSVIRSLRGIAGRRVGAALTLVLVLPLLEVGAQGAPRRGERVTIRSGTALRSTPGGEVIGVSSRAITAPVELVQSTFVRVTVEGHVAAGDVRLAANRSRGEVLPANGTTLRATGTANGAAVAELRRSAYVFPLRAGAVFPPARAGAFLAARRAIWVDVSRVTGGASRAAASATAPRAEPSPASAPADTAAPRSSGADAATQGSAAGAAAGAAPSVPAPSVPAPTFETRAPATLRAGPGGDAVATVPGGVALSPLARERGWVRVRIEGWLPDSMLEAAGARSAGSLSAADLRANPTGTVGRLVRWTVEALAFQTADGIRQGFTPGERYLLARGPGDERAVLYLALPDALVAAAQALPPLTEITITARVRTGRSQPAGVPILDLLELTRR